MSRPPLVPPEPDGRIPVFAPWQREVGPLLSLGMLTAAARRHDGGALARRYDIHRPEPSDVVREELVRSAGPAVLLCSDYVWSVEHNLELADRARRVRPDLVVLHGGPSCPGRVDEAERFLRDRAAPGDVLVHGEGEAALCDVLAALRPGSGHEPDRLSDVPGISFVDADGIVRHTAARERTAELDALPSPYLTGEYDDIEPAAWHYLASIETNRGCPYGCTFCDWGSATRSRIRKFSIDRVTAEIEWCAAHGIEGVQICDANFGILARDVEVTDGIVASRGVWGRPSIVALTPAKNTTRHLSSIVEKLLGADILLSTAISLQTTDPRTLQLVDRSNISTDSYLDLAAELRRHGQPLQGDLLIGMPGQTVDSYRRDLQFFMDHDIAPRTWSVRMLPNAPMNDPGYRRDHRLQVNRNGHVVATSTMSADDRARMLRLRKAQVIGWKFGLVKPLLRVLQWDHGVPAVTALDRLAELTHVDPDRYPVLSWTFEHFDLFLTTAVSWRSFIGEMATFVQDEMEVRWDTGLDAAADLLLFMLPSPNRTLPARIDLAHDFPAYIAPVRRTLFETGRAGRPERPLREYPPTVVGIDTDPHRLCSDGLHMAGDPRSEILEGNFWIDIGFSYELPVRPPVDLTEHPIGGGSSVTDDPPP